MLFQADPATFPITSFTANVTEVFKAANNTRDGSGANPGDCSYLGLADLRGGEDNGVNLFFIAKIIAKIQFHLAI